MESFVQRQLYIGVNSWFYIFAWLNVLNWARTGSFMQSLSAADLGYELWFALDKNSYWYSCVTISLILGEEASFWLGISLIK